MQKNNKYAAFYEGGLYSEFAELEGKESPKEPLRLFPFQKPLRGVI